jgi:alkylation response protein AidB-like acyl-CoA dehydrogenase
MDVSCDDTPMPQSDREQREIVAVVRDFVERDVVPVAAELERRDEFPEQLVGTMKELGLFGLLVPEAYGGLGVEVSTYALVQTELSRGWMSLSGVLNTHTIAAWMIASFGTEEQRERLLPRLATGELRAAYSMTEPHAGSDVQSIRTRADREGDDYLLTGQKMWVTNGLRAGMVMLLAKTDPAAEPPHRGMSGFVVEKEPGVAEQPGLTVGAPLKKLGYKGVESVELAFDGFRIPAANLLGGEEGGGFRQFMSGIELGRINIAARAVGVGRAALEHALRYAKEREAFGKPIAEHQAIQLKLADMATKLEAARLLTAEAARRKDAGERVDLHAGMAKLFATETAHEVVFEAMRIFGGYGYSPEYPIERLYRDTPLMIIGEGTNEMQRLVIARRLLED